MCEEVRRACLLTMLPFDWFANGAAEAASVAARLCRNARRHSIHGFKSGSAGKVPENSLQGENLQRENSFNCWCTSSAFPHLRCLNCSISPYYYVQAQVQGRATRFLREIFVHLLYCLIWMSHWKLTCTVYSGSLLLHHIKQTAPFAPKSNFFFFCTEIKKKSQTTKLGLIIETSAGSDLWEGSISVFLEEMMWMASSCVLCVLWRYWVFEVLTLTLSLWGEQAKETCHTIGWDLDLCFASSDLWPLLVFRVAAALAP